MRKKKRKANLHHLSHEPLNEKMELRKKVEVGNVH
ncbi:transcriptional regulator, partial [Escherichia coli]